MGMQFTQLYASPVEGFRTYASCQAEFWCQRGGVEEGGVRAYAHAAGRMFAETYRYACAQLCIQSRMQLPAACVVWHGIVQPRKESRVARQVKRVVARIG